MGMERGGRGARCGDGGGTNAFNDDEQGRETSDTGSLDRLQAELDDLLAADCPLCGGPAIEMISRPFPVYGDGPAAFELPSMLA
eukprot:768783-Hanusia_phi.AAC.1